MHPREHQISKVTDIIRRSSGSADNTSKKVRTRREKFLADMKRVVSWVRMIGVIKPLYLIGVPWRLRMYSCSGGAT